MTMKIIDAIQSVKDITLSDSALTTLLDFERVLDELNLYAFKHWKQGEVVKGPDYEKYFISVTLMWPYKCMPDPRGGEQLLNYNCVVQYRKDLLEYPVLIKSDYDFKPGTKIAKTKKTKVWLVEITMPKQLMDEIAKGSIDIENETLDMEDMETAYEEDFDETDNAEMSPDQGQMPMDQGMGQPGSMSPLSGAAPQQPNQQQPGGF